MTDPVYLRMAVIGSGLIGSSVARAARASGAVGEIVVYDSDPAVRARALALGVADRAEETPAAAAAGADLVVLATPGGVSGAVAAALAPSLDPGATLTDVGSCKAVVAEAFAKIERTDVHAIPGHPVAGTEKSGPDAGFAELFENRWVILCPRPTDAPEAVDRLTAFWTRLGARVERMDAAHHDRVLVLRDLQVLAVGGIERALRLLAHLHAVERGAMVVAAPPVVGSDLGVRQSPTGIRGGTEGRVERVDTHRGGRNLALGLRRHAQRADVSGNAGRERLPTGRGALVDIHSRVRTARADHRNHLRGTADRVREPGRASRATYRREHKRRAD